MGRPSDVRRRHRLQRPGKRARARVKKHWRGRSFHSVPGAGTCELKAGRKKQNEFNRSRSNPFGARFERKLAYGETADHVFDSAGPSCRGTNPESGNTNMDGQATSEPVRASNSGPLRD